MKRARRIVAKCWRAHDFGAVPWYLWPLAFAFAGFSILCCLAGLHQKDGERCQLCGEYLYDWPES